MCHKLNQHLNTCAGLSEVGRGTLPLPDFVNQKLTIFKPGGDWQIMPTTKLLASHPPPRFSDLPLTLLWVTFSLKFYHDESTSLDSLIRHCFGNLFISVKYLTPMDRQHWRRYWTLLVDPTKFRTLGSTTKVHYLLQCWRSRCYN